MPSLTEVVTKNVDKFKDLGVDKVIAICKELGLNVIANPEKEPEYLPKSRFDEVTGVKNELKKQVAELTVELGKLKEAAGSDEKLKAKITELEKEIAQSGERAKQVLAKASAKVAAIQAKAVDPDDLLKFVDFGKVIVNADDTVTGIDEQVKELVKTKAYLFDVKKADVGGGTNPPGGAGSSFDGINPWKKDSFNLTKQGEIITKDPAKAAKLMQEAGVKVTI